MGGPPHRENAHRHPQSRYRSIADSALIAATGSAFTPNAPALACALVLAAASVQAQQSTNPAPDSATARDARRVASGTRWLPRIRLDNDAYNFWLHPGKRTDEEYTNGVVLSLDALHGSWLTHRLLGAAPACGLARTDSSRCHAATAYIGQDMFTPNLDRPPYAVPDWESERPYAGWLYAGYTGRSVSRRSARILDVQLGVTGRPALGETSQRIAHWINRRYTTPAEGWETQVAFQPGVQAGYAHSVLLLRGSMAGKAFVDLVPTAGLTLGTVRTMAEAGGKLRLGYNLSHPLDPRRWRSRSPLEYWVSAGARTTWVAYDVTLDGTLGTGGRSVDRVPGVHDYGFGAGLRMHRLSLGWEAITRSRQYTTGPLHHAFSSMWAAWEFYR